MKNPKLRAEVMILNEDHSKVPVQCDLSETFYRFPGGSIKFGETAKEAIMRELMEEYDLKIDVQEVVTNEIRHKEHEDIILIWKSIDELKEKPAYPEGIVSYLEKNNCHVNHFISDNST
ncbi:NUDIX domain-containing protein [Bacillus wiedmannii]|uniref:DNA mismatch repair protein MutT n=1 Tax=Bacillus wiedmannii TaxID=1890302 RepID=A0A2A7BII4_9BACI|nr:NUDIX domain-containing protein [Bacillus wiedmannii]PDY32892.1 DNA mismatch repair protein MutT [Bacillus wiedmannii]